MTKDNDIAIHIGCCAASQDTNGELCKQPRQGLMIGGAMAQVTLFFRSLWKLGCDDRRRVIHAFKVGLALSLVCLLMILEPTYQEIGKNTIWAVMTVIVIFEFTAGATLCKGLNRGFGTLVAALLALGISHLSVLGGELVEALIVGVSVFTIGAGATFARFIPKIKAKFDYGIVIFLLTFSMILVMAYQDVNSVHTSLDRLFTICIGCGISLTVSLLVCPIWAGEDLHQLIVGNLDKLSLALQECVNKYVSEESPKELQLSKMLMGASDEDRIYNHYRGALLSSANEESLANFASWEPPHGQFKLGHPWKKYLKVGVAMRHCAYGIVALHSCLHSESQAPFLLRQVFREELVGAATEATSVLQELSLSIRTMRTRGSNARNRLASAEKAARNLNKVLRGRTRLFFSSDPASSQQPDSNPPVKPRQPSSANATAVAHPQDAEAKHPKSDLPTEDCGGGEDATRSSGSKILMHCLFSSPPLSCGGVHPTASSGNGGTLEAELSAALLSVATFASLLVEVVARLGAVVDAAEEVAKAAHFKLASEEEAGLEMQVKGNNNSGRELSSTNATVE